MNENGINVLSLFDGMSAGQQALKELDVKVNNYYASEIDKNSIKVTQHNFPNTIQIGDVTELDFISLKNKNIDIIIGGFPCRNLSRTVINREGYNKGLKGEHSKLFYYLLEAINIIKPKYFFVENVESMSDNDKEIISELLGVEPIMLDSKDFSAQSRKRYYWTNIPQNYEYEYNSDLFLGDIVLDSNLIKDKYWYSQSYEWLGYDRSPVAILDIKGYDMIKRVYGLHQKSPTLTSCRGGNLQKKVLQNSKARKLTPLEYERLQGFPDDYSIIVADTHRYNMLGDSWNVPTVKQILKGIIE